MCTVSAIGDHYGDRWRDKPFAVPGTTPYIYPQVAPNTWPAPPDEPPVISREEFEILKIQVQEMHEMLRVAKKYDEDSGQPDCEMDEKIETLRRVADFVGVSLEDVFGADS